MKLQKDFIVVSGNNRFELHRLIITDKDVYDIVDEDNYTLFEYIFRRKECGVISKNKYEDIIKLMHSIIYGKFADPETPIYDLVNSFKYIHNIFLNEPCED